MRTPAARWFPVIRGAYGVTLLGVPGLLTRLAGRPGDRWARGAARLLGARQLAQAVLTAPEPGVMTLALGVEADLAHAVSMLGLAVLDRRRRRLGYTDAVVAIAFAAAGVLVSRQVRATAPARGRAAAPARGRAAAPVRVGHPLARAAHLRETIAARVAALTIPPPIRRGLSPTSSSTSSRAAVLFSGG